MDWVVLILAGFGALMVIGYFANKRAEERKAEELRQRREYLLRKYGDAHTVEDIINGVIRQGMTSEMVVDSWGAPVDVDERVFKTKTAHTYKYHQTGRNQFASRVKLENGIVVGWKQR